MNTNWFELLAGTITGVICTLLTLWYQKTKIIIESYVSSMPLLRFKTSDDRALKLSVNKSALSGNKDVNVCDLRGVGKNIRFRKNRFWKSLVFMLLGTTLVLLGVQVFDDHAIFKLFPNTLINLLGGEIVKTEGTKVVFSTIVKIVLFLIFFVIGVYTFILGINKSLDAKVKKNW